MQNENPKIENLITESDLCELFGVNKDALGRLRNTKKLPFLRITKNTRLYLESDIMEWLIENRTVMNVRD